MNPPCTPSLPLTSGSSTIHKGSIHRVKPKKIVAFGHRRNSFRGFSLIEVVIALGVISFAMVGLMGLIPVGLKTSREAIDTTIQAQMAQMIRNQILLSEFTDLNAWKGKTLYFDDQGLSVESADSSTRVFTAVVDIQDVKVPITSMAESVARVVRVDITNNAAPRVGSTFTLVVANTGSGS
jgi:uncharacterized protein (TIGR02598 family)